MRTVLAALALPALACLLFVLLAAAPVLAAASDPLVLDGPADPLTLGSHFDYATDPDWQFEAEDFVGSSAIAMQPLPGAIADFGYTPARIWLRVVVVNGTAEADEWRFFVHANFTQQIAIYQVGADGSIATLLDLTEDSPFSARPIDNPQLVAPFTLASGASATLLVSYYSQGSSRLSMSVETPESFAAQSRVAEAKSFAFYGMVLVMIALAAIALVVLRQPVFAAYSGYLVFALMYVAHADGAAFQYVWPNLPRFNSMASVVAGSAAMVCGSLFAITFLRTARNHPVMHRILLSVVTVVVVIDVVLWALDPQLLKQMLVVLILLSTLTSLSAGIVAAWTRFREVRFYILSYGAALIPAVLFTLRYALGIEPSFITTYDAVRLALLFDALMMGLAIFDRYNHLRRAAAEETLAHAERNLALGRRLAALEESYELVRLDTAQREESVRDTVHDLRQPMHALRLSLRQMLEPNAEKAGDIGHVESALGEMERMVAERLAGGGGAKPDGAAASGTEKTAR